MERESRSALKEWEAVEQILAAGRASLLLRKGGIWEQKEGFRVEHREFWIFPTHFHQNPHELAPAFAWALEPGLAARPDGERIRLEHYAVVHDAFRVEDLEALRRLDGLHPLDAATVESRFRYKDRPYLHALTLRVYRMPEPHLVENTLDYEGCVSWVELDEALPTTGAVPVLTDEEFAAARGVVAERLGGGPGIERL
jgi:hypothetical protein